MATKTKFKIFNGPMPTTAARAAVTTGTAIKTMLQVKGLTTLKILEWGVTGDGAAVAAGVEWELLTTALIAATVTASVEADIVRIPTRPSEVSDSRLAADFLTLSTTGTGYTSSGEGTVAATKTFDSVFVTPTDNFIRVLSSPILVPAATILRVRCKAAVAINAICWVVVEG